MKFRTRVEHVEAVQCRIPDGTHSVDGPLTSLGVAGFFDVTVKPGWLADFLSSERKTLQASTGGKISLNVGGLHLFNGDWLVRDADGTLGVCRKDAFAKVYEADVPGPDEGASYFVFDPKYAKQMRSEADARAYATDMLSCGEIKERAAVLRIVAMFELERPKVVEVKPASPNRTKD